MTPEQRKHQALIGRIGAFERWAREPDRLKATEPMRLGFKSKFDREARAMLEAENPGKPISDRELVIRSEYLRKAHFARLALASAKARAKRKR